MVDGNVGDGVDNDNDDNNDDDVECNVLFVGVYI